MKPRIELLPEKKLIGMQTIMSLTDNKTMELWRSFMPKRKDIKTAVNSDLYSIQRYDDLYFRNFSPNAKFEKWAAIEVTDTEVIPKDMHVFTLPTGLYAVFLYKGLSSDNSIFHYIFAEWLPNSKYHLDHRPHFEILGEKYKNNDPNSEEEIWIPIKPKA